MSISKKIFFVGLINAHRLFQTFCLILFLKIILLFHLNFKSPGFLLKLNIDNIEDGRKYFLISFVIFFTLAYFSKKLIHSLAGQKKMISQKLSYIIFFNELFFIFTIFFLFFNSYIIFLLLISIILILISMKLSQINKTLSIKIGIVLLTFLTFNNQLFFDEIISFFIFLILFRSYTKVILQLHKLKKKKQIKIKELLRI